MPSALVLTFHGLERDNIASHTASDHATERYLVSEQRFEQTIRQCSPKGACTVAEFVDKTTGHWTILTLDDGFISDFEIAFPALIARGIKATFFITVQKIGRPGYATVEQLKKMAQAGMEIGSHGLTHRYMVTMPNAETVREIRESKEKLERKIGVSVTSFAPVGGHFHKWMLEVARNAGYRAFATMIPGRTYSNKDMVMLRRNHIQAHYNAAYVSRLLNRDRRTLVLNSLRYRLLNVPKAILGMQNYDRTKVLFFKHKYRQFRQD